GAIRAIPRLAGCRDEVLVAFVGDEAVGDLPARGLKAGIGGLADGPEAAVHRSLIQTERGQRLLNGAALREIRKARVPWPVLEERARSLEPVGEVGDAERVAVREVVAFEREVVLR